MVRRLRAYGRCTVLAPPGSAQVERGILQSYNRSTGNRGSLAPRMERAGNYRSVTLRPEHDVDHAPQVERQLQVAFRLERCGRRSARA
jgi:hypothetical protein